MLERARSDPNETTHLLHVLLFTSREVQQILSVLHEDCSLRLGLSDIDTTSEDSDFGVLSLENSTY